MQSTKDAQEVLRLDVLGLEKSLETLQCTNLRDCISQYLVAAANLYGSVEKAWARRKRKEYAQSVLRTEQAWFKDRQDERLEALQTQFYSLGFGRLICLISLHGGTGFRVVPFKHTMTSDTTKFKVLLAMKPGFPTLVKRYIRGQDVSFDLRYLSNALNLKFMQICCRYWRNELRGVAETLARKLLPSGVRIGPYKQPWDQFQATMELLGRPDRFEEPRPAGRYYENHVFSLVKMARKDIYSDRSESDKAKLIANESNGHEILWIHGGVWYYWKKRFLFILPMKAQ